MRAHSMIMVMAAGVGLALGAPVSATPRTPSFFDIEHVVGEDGIRDAEQALVDRIAGPGVALDAARSALEEVGASYVRTSRTGSIEYVYAAPETIVTVLLLSDGAVVRSANVTRQTLGG